MTLGQIKQSLARFPADMDNLETFIASSKDGEPALECLCFCAFVPIEGFEAVLLGDKEAIKVFAEKFNMQKFDGEKISSEDLDEV